MPASAASAVTGWRRTVLAALVDASADPAAVLADAAAALGCAAPPVLEVRFVADQDWVRLTQSQFEPIPIGERLVITPSWHATDDATRIEIVLDPGLAFGTGSHPTTRLCLQWLERHLPAGATVIDYGCGSGILEIAAARLGAASVASTSTRRRSSRRATTRCATASRSRCARAPTSARRRPTSWSRTSCRAR
jgi:ribosomal protein L11 methyltransferase